MLFLFDGENETILYRWKRQLGLPTIINHLDSNHPEDKGNIGASKYFLNRKYKHSI